MALTKSVAILGCGPAGLLAAHAAQMCNWDFRIYSRKVKSKLYGAQYLHQPIPGIDNGGPKLVKYQLRGTPEQYRRKVYGDNWDGTTSPEDLLEQHYAWNLRSAYDQLWNWYEHKIVNVDITPKIFTRHSHALWNKDLVISTVPRKIWAEPGDVFESTKIWALGDTEMPRVEPAYRPEPFSVICEADPKVPWYRVSNIFDYCTIEWPYSSIWTREGVFGGVIGPHPGASVVEKPLSHNSTAASDFIHLGRYGAWQKGVLTSDVFYEAMRTLAGDSIDSSC